MQVGSLVNVLLYYKTWLTSVYLLRQCEVFACSIDLRSAPSDWLMYLPYSMSRILYLNGNLQ